MQNTKIKQNKNHISPDAVSAADLFRLFITGSVVGFILEGIWHLILHGSWESHSALVWGPFCIVYGIGADVLYVFARPLRDKSVIIQFPIFCVVGAAVEYFAGLLQELMLGSVSWDYSGEFMNIGGRVCLSMSLIWGVLGVLFLKLFLSPIEQMLVCLRAPKYRIITFILAVFTVLNLFVSYRAVLRWGERIKGYEAKDSIERLLDGYYGDEKMEKLFPNMKFLK